MKRNDFDSQYFDSGVSCLQLQIAVKRVIRAPINLGTLMVGTIDLNSATAPTNVPVNPAITATFSTDVDATTATTDNVTLTEDYDNVSIPLTVSVPAEQLLP